MMALFSATVLAASLAPGIAFTPSRTFLPSLARRAAAAPTMEYERRGSKVGHALIVQNKDEVTLPLELEQLPTPKAFRDAIASLSPEQQRFARAYRAMQLEGSVFGVLVLQLKPSLGWLNYHAACAVGRHPSARLQAS